MIDPAEVERYRLPQEENERIFFQEIVPDLLEGRVPQETPTVVAIIAPPGAGKSRLAAIVAERLNQQGGFVDVDSDLYKPYHPAYDDLMAQDDTLMAAKDATCSSGQYCGSRCVWPIRAIRRGS
ncbi:hypothetical protein GPZ77_33260 [Streptomyces sp. QHH-9511]|uniref:zeta toxin family protein n=1 Tax=Streptomyces sp. QHH-9511 TaxID=2684468 RepID=UPI00131876FD|nr:zeta toxin family protein [Streptomyces sp. QHH-9511]QGZ52535.1 hypothetical protein GPZ77_33260 [Streptomyces sp. QHH-9511]